MHDHILHNASALYYKRLAGDSERPCLIFLHEGLGCAAAWKDFPERLCRRTGCPGLLFDRLGHGLSAPLTAPRGSDYLHTHALEELPAVTTQLIPGQDFILIGHSDGGSIALIHAAQRPPGLMGIVTEAAHVFVEPETLTGIEATVDAFQAGQLAGLTRYHGQKTRDLFFAWADTWRNPHFLAWDITALLPTIEVPLLVIQGREDVYATEEQVNVIVSGVSGPANTLLLDNCNHTPHREAPEAVLGAMADFIEAVVSRTVV